MSNGFDLMNDNNSQNTTDDVLRELQIARTAAQTFLAELPPMQIYANDAGLMQSDYDGIRSSLLDLIELATIGMHEATRLRDRIRARDLVVTELHELVEQVTIASLRVAPAPSAAIN